MFISIIFEYYLLVCWLFLMMTRLLANFFKITKQKTMMMNWESEFVELPLFCWNNNNNNNNKWANIRIIHLHATTINRAVTPLYLSYIVKWHSQLGKKLNKQKNINFLERKYAKLTKNKRERERKRKHFNDFFYYFIIILIINIYWLNLF